MPISPESENVQWKIRTTFGKLCFESETHRYWLEGQDHQFMSATTFIHGLQPEFKAESVAASVASKRGVSALEVLEEWKNKNEYSKALGTFIHLVMETYIKNYMDDFDDDMYWLKDEAPKANRKKAFAVAKQAEMLYEKVIEDWEPVELEFRIYDINCSLGDDCGNPLRLAGTVDALFRNRDNGEFWIFDWKTNEKLNHKGFNGKRMNPPFQKLEACNINEYRLQLSLYKAVLERHNVCAISGLKLGHITEEGSHLISISPVNLSGRISGW